MLARLSNQVDTALVEAVIAKVLAAMERDGALAELRVKWFGEAAR